MEELISEKSCTRCEKELTISNYSWFTDEVICHACMKIEGKILSQIDQDKEDVRNSGEIPTEVLEEDITWGEYPSKEETAECSD